MLQIFSRALTNVRFFVRKAVLLQVCAIYRKGVEVCSSIDKKIQVLLFYRENAKPGVS